MIGHESKAWVIHNRITKCNGSARRDHAKTLTVIGTCVSVGVGGLLKPVRVVCALCRGLWCTVQAREIKYGNHRISETELTIKVPTETVAIRKVG